MVLYIHQDLVITNSNPMQKIQYISSKIITNSAFILAIGFLFGVTGITKVDAQAQSTYFVDITGNGCGNNCADFYRYLTANGISVTNTNNRNTSTSNNNGSTTSGTSTATTTRPTTPSTSYVQYPYYQYTNFPSTDAYYRASTTRTTSYVQYPYYTYAYFQNPASKPDSYLSGQYPESNYIYYGKDANEQMNKYKKTYTSTSSVNRYASTVPGTMNSNSGFTITSIQN